GPPSGGGELIVPIDLDLSEGGPATLVNVTGQGQAYRVYVPATDDQEAALSAAAEGLKWTADMLEGCAEAEALAQAPDAIDCELGRRRLVEGRRRDVEEHQKWAEAVEADRDRRLWMAAWNREYGRLSWAQSWESGARACERLLERHPLSETVAALR